MLYGIRAQCSAIKFSYPDLTRLLACSPLRSPHHPLPVMAEYWQYVSARAVGDAHGLLRMLRIAHHDFVILVTHLA